MVKRSEHFALNKCSVLPSEMFSTFDRGLICDVNPLNLMVDEMAQNMSWNVTVKTENSMDFL